MINDNFGSSSFTQAHWSFRHSWKMVFRIQVALSYLIFRKQLGLSHLTGGFHTEGQGPLCCKAADHLERFADFYRVHWWILQLGWKKLFLKIEQFRQERIISTLANIKITVALKVSPAPRVSTTPAGGGKAGLVIRPWRGCDNSSVIIVGLFL